MLFIYLFIIIIIIIIYFLINHPSSHLFIRRPFTLSPIYLSI